MKLGKIYKTRKLAKNDEKITTEWALFLKKKFGSHFKKVPQSPEKLLAAAYRLSFLGAFYFTLRHNFVARWCAATLKFGHEVAIA